MSTTTVYSAAVIHAQVQALKIEVDLQPGLPSLRILGSSARQAVEMRICLRLAFKNSGLLFPLGRITVNPNRKLKDEINYLDLAIAAALINLNKKASKSRTEI